MVVDKVIIFVECTKSGYTWEIMFPLTHTVQSLKGETQWNNQVSREREKKKTTKKPNFPDV